ncbi:MAG: hypothetical protein PUG68_04800 [Lachnospiraceae bacterium]|jgi:hypothetical protein|nr:hypothetical protein [Lachnospiraceae bacterium]MDD7327108.1 hypothetical protein [Lachnospiraceae bacterium]MDY2759837.1 DUF6715 family protein [Lachnospiraceae bacterium]
MKARRAARTVVVVAICACIIVAYYIYLDRSASKNVANSDNVQVTEKDRLLDMDFGKNYPPTPREVIKTYNRYLSLCIGDTKLSKNDVKTLSGKIREMMDSELANENPPDEYADRLASEINDYKSRKAKIISTQVCDTSDVIYGKLDGKDVAYVQAGYSIKEASSYSKTYQKFVLRMDSNSHWKIVGFHLTDADGNTISGGHTIKAGEKTK